MAELFKNFREDKPEEVFAYLAPRIQKLDEVLGRGNYMMIGAYVRDHYLLEAKLKPYRSTQDVDFSVAVTAEEDFLEKLELIGRQSGAGAGQGSSSERSVLCRVMDGGVEVDILPFGQFVQDGIYKHGEKQWDVTGQAESFGVAVPWEVQEGFAVKIPPLHCMLGLKIIAWGIRHEIYGDKDAEDFHKLLEAGVKLEEKNIFNSGEGRPYLEECDYDSQKASVKLISDRLSRDFRGPALSRCQEILSDEGVQAEFERVCRKRSITAGSIFEHEYRERFDCFSEAFLESRDLLEM